MLRYQVDYSTDIQREILPEFGNEVVKIPLFPVNRLVNANVSLSYKSFGKPVSDTDLKKLIFPFNRIHFTADKDPLTSNP